MTDTSVPVVHYGPPMMDIAAPMHFGLNLPNTLVSMQHHFHVSNSSMPLHYSPFESHQTTQTPFTSLMMVRPLFFLSFAVFI